MPGLWDPRWKEASTFNLIQPELPFIGHRWYQGELWLRIEKLSKARAPQLRIRWGAFLLFSKTSLFLSFQIASKQKQKAWKVNPAQTLRRTLPHPRKMRTKISSTHPWNYRTSKPLKYQGTTKKHEKQIQNDHDNGGNRHQYLSPYPRARSWPESHLGKQANRK